MEFYGFTLKKVRPYIISNKNIRECDIYHNGIFLAHYSCKNAESAKKGEPLLACITYAGAEAQKEMEDAVSEVYEKPATKELVQKLLFRAFDLYEYEFTMKALQKKGEAAGVMILASKEDPEKTVALVALRSLDWANVKNAKKMFRYMNFGLASVCSCEDDFVVA